MKRALALAVVLGLAPLWVLARTPPSTPLVAQPCRDPMLVDGRLHCGGLAGAQLLQQCAPPHRPSSTDAPAAGDAIRIDAYCRPGHAARMNPDRGWSRMSPSELAHLAVVIDLNGASVEELTSLHGVGPVVAARIDAARPFRTVDELLQVRGIGPVTLKRNRARLRISPP